MYICELGSCHIGHIDVALRGHRGVGAAMERLTAHIGCRLAGDSEGQQHLFFEHTLANGVVSIIGEPDRVVRAMNTPWARGKIPSPNERRKSPSRSNTIIGCSPRLKT